MLTEVIGSQGRWKAHSCKDAWCSLCGYSSAIRWNAYRECWIDGFDQSGSRGAVGQASNGATGSSGEVADIDLGSG